MSTLTTGQRVISRALALMQNGKARSWSHAIQLAAESLEATPEPHKAKRQKERTT